MVVMKVVTVGCADLHNLFIQLSKRSDQLGSRNISRVLETGDCGISNSSIDCM